MSKLNTGAASGSSSAGSGAATSAQTPDQNSSATPATSSTVPQSDQATPSSTPDQNAASTDQSTTTSTKTRRHQKGAAAGAADQNAAGDQGTGDNNGKLPQTGSPLPLLALAGFGTTAAGFITRKRMKK